MLSRKWIATDASKNKIYKECLWIFHWQWIEYTKRKRNLRNEYCCDFESVYSLPASIFSQAVHPTKSRQRNTEKWWIPTKIFCRHLASEFVVLMYLTLKAMLSSTTQHFIVHARENEKIWELKDVKKQQRNKYIRWNLEKSFSVSFAAPLSMQGRERSEVCKF